jgi:hypothetical protein
VAVRSEYRRKYDSHAAAYQDALAELEESPQAPEESPGPQAPRPQPAPVDHNGNGHNGHMMPPWQTEIEDARTRQYAASVSAPPSRNLDSMSYAAPRQDPSRVRLTAEQMQLCKENKIDPIVYARNLLIMEDMKKRGDLQT